MPAVQVRDFSQEIYDRICQEAKENGRSIMQQTKHIVIEHFEQIDKAALEAQAASKVAQVPATTPDPQPGTVGFPNPFHKDSPEVIQKRVERRKALFERIASRTYPPEVYEVDDVQLIREMRDER